MTYEEPLEGIEPHPPVPPSLQYKLRKILKGCRRIRVSVDVDGRSKHLNTVVVNAAQGQLPEDEPAEIAEAVTRVMLAGYHELAAEAEDELGQLRFRIQAEKRDSNGKRSRPGFVQQFAPEIPDDVEDTTRSMEGEILVELLERYRNHADAVQAHAEAANEMILRMANSQIAPMTAAVELTQFASQMLHSGLQANVNAWQMQFNAETAKTQAELEDRKSQRFWERADKYVDMAAEQFLEHIAAKVSGIKSKAKKRAQTATSGGPAPAGAPAPDPTVPPADDPPTDDDETRKAKANPLAYMAESLAITFSPKQRQAIRKEFASEEWDLLESLWCAETDAEVLERWTEIGERISLVKLLSIMKHCDAEQRDLFQAFQKHVEEAKRSKG